MRKETVFGNLIRSEDHKNMYLVARVWSSRVYKGCKRKLKDLFSRWHFFEYILSRGVTALINVFPLVVSTWIARRVGDVLFLLMEKRRCVALHNINIAFGDSKSNAEKRKLVRASFRNMAVAMHDLFRVPKLLSESDWRFRFDDTNYLDQALARGKGVVLVASHFGSWEYLAFLAHERKYPLSVVVKKIKNPYIDHWITSLRQAMGLNVIKKSDAARAVLSELRKNHIVAILIDQWAGDEGLWINFFGEPTSTTSLPARLAEKTGCALVPAYCSWFGNGLCFFEIRVKPEILISRNRDDYVNRTTKELNRLLERQIIAYPDQWIWIHKRWKGKKRYVDERNFKCSAKKMEDD